MGIPADSAPEVVINGQGGAWDVNVLPPLRDFVDRLSLVDVASLKSQSVDAANALFNAASGGQAGSGGPKRASSFGMLFSASDAVSRGAPMFPGREREKRVTVLLPLKSGIRSCTSLFAKDKDGTLTEPILCNVQVKVALAN